jgi:hypothetical protein
MMGQGIPLALFAFVSELLALKLPLFRLALATTLPFLASCNAGALVLGYVATHQLGSQQVSGALSGLTPTTKVGYIAWIELMQDGSVSGRLNFDLVQDKNVTFDKIGAIANNRFTLDVTPKANVAEGTYVVFAWDDVNGNNIYEGDKDERRAPEVYRVRGQATTRNLWATEKFVFTDRRLAIEYADLTKLDFAIPAATAATPAPAASATPAPTPTPAPAI